jgi:hypothetical protein
MRRKQEFNYLLLVESNKPGSQFNLLFYDHN